MIPRGVVSSSQHSTVGLEVTRRCSPLPHLDGPHMVSIKTPPQRRLFQSHSISILWALTPRSWRSKATVCWVDLARTESLESAAHNPANTQLSPLLQRYTARWLSSTGKAGTRHGRHAAAAGSSMGYDVLTALQPYSPSDAQA